jgi:protein-disulfide isomerase
VSYAKDTACKRAPFAVKYVVALLEDEYPEPAIREYYHQKYEVKDTVQLDLEKAPRVGPSDAPVRIVEFYDYGCSHCAEFRPKLKQVEQEHAGQVAAYFKMFPLGNWPDSRSAAQAALAANAQGRFAEMHDLLFANAHHNGEQEVKGYAAQLGLDLAKFAQDYQAFGPQVDADEGQGKALGINLTPTVYFNNRPYKGPLEPKYLGMWIDEEIAVNR